MDRSQTIVLTTLILALLFSWRTVRASIRREKIHGGLPARIFHYVGVTAYLGVVPSALLGTIFVGPLKLGIPLALTYLLVALVALFLYAVWESSARANIVLEDRGWTEYDARSSGL